MEVSEISSIDALKDRIAIYLAEKNENKLPSRITLSSIFPAKGAKVTMLGLKGKLKWEKDGKGFYVEIPERIRENPPCNYAWTIKISEIE